MKRQYKILQSKIKELESDIIQVASYPANASLHHLLAEGVNQRLLFLKNLLAAEIASQNSNLKPENLDRLREQLQQLESAFREWDSYRNPNTGADVHVVGDENDSGSVCSCTESCLNNNGGDGGGDAADVEQEVGSMGSESSVYQEPEVAVYDQPAAAEETVFKKEKSGVYGGGRRWRLCRLLSVGALVLASFMVHFSDYLVDIVDHEVVRFTPT